MTIKMVLSRSAQAFVMAFLVLTAVFIIMRLSGDPVWLFLPVEATDEDVIRYRHLLGLDKPLYIQYLIYLGRIVRGDFGNSLIYRGSPALEVVLERMPATIELTVFAMLITIFIAIPAGLIAAVKPNTVFSYAVTVVALLGQAAPPFWLGLMMILLFSVKWGLLPTGGRGGILNLVMPSIVLGSWGAARTARLVRAGMIEVLQEDYIRTARSKGLPERVTVVRHALKNALLPVLSILGLTIGAMLGGAVITETVFAWPSVGRLIVQSILKRDFPVVQVAVVLISFIFVVSNFVVDVLYTIVDPRIRYN